MAKNYIYLVKQLEKQFRPSIKVQGAQLTYQKTHGYVDKSWCKGIDIKMLPNADKYTILNWFKILTQRMCLDDIISIIVLFLTTEDIYTVCKVSILLHALFKKFAETAVPPMLKWFHPCCTTDFEKIKRIKHLWLDQNTVISDELIKFLKKVFLYFCFIFI